jgi:hypothetical protein
MIDKHNTEMLKVLEEEQEAENKRDEQSSKLTIEERKKVEREFGMERARAQTRIQKLAE